MQIYTVGGAVRDTLLGLPVKDRDYVVVGATPEQMVALGYTPVGKDFPVFLHPQTHEEYALARTERKTAPGYRGFVFHADGAVTLEEDLVRRDLTINAMALSAEGVLIDPFDGQADLRQRIFRHISDAFAEDPVRILRVARFAARFTEFSVDSSTNALMQRMVAAGEVDALVPERVWQELARGLLASQPSRMFDVLHQCGALARLLPELDHLWAAPVSEGTTLGAIRLRSVDVAAQHDATLAVRLAVLLCDVNASASVAVTPPLRSKSIVDAIAARLKIPTECRDLAVMTAREYQPVQQALGLSAIDLVGLIERCDGLRKPERFLSMLTALDFDHRARSSLSVPLPSMALLTSVLNATRAVDAGEIALRWQHSPASIPEQIRLARVDAVSEEIATTQRTETTQLQPKATDT